MTEEHALMNTIQAGLSLYCTMFRINVGKGYTPDDRYFSTGVPVGFSDLFGFRNKDGKAVFIEVKTKTGRVSPQQKQFLNAMQTAGAIAGVCRSLKDALRLIGIYQNNI